MFLCMPSIESSIDLILVDMGDDECVRFGLSFLYLKKKRMNTCISCLYMDFLLLCSPDIFLHWGSKGDVK